MYRREAERRGYPVDSLIAKNIQDFKRSCMRGLGGPARPRPLPLLELAKLSAAREAWNRGRADQSARSGVVRRLVALPGGRVVDGAGKIGRDSS